MEQKSSELFELCKSVYDKTGWVGTESLWASNDLDFKPETYEIVSMHHRHYPADFVQQEFIPVYTSDYLLEKLPSSIKSHEYPEKRAVLWTRKEDDWMDKYPDGIVTYFAWYFVTGVVYGVSDYGESSDAPLKALLKLTLALHEAGKLPTNKGEL